MLHPLPKKINEQMGKYTTVFHDILAVNISIFLDL
jgi:hypothetical protein